MALRGLKSSRTTFGITHLRGPDAGLKWPSRKVSAGAVLLYLCLAALALLPLWSDWTGTFVGPAFGSSQIWQMRQVWDAVLAGQLPPLQTNLLSYPDLGALVFVGWPFMAVGIMFRLFMGTIPAANCTLLLFLAAGSFSMFSLAWRCSGSRSGSIIAGALYGFSTYALSSLANGHVYSMFVLWLPLLVLTYDALLSDLRPRTVLLFFAVVLLAVLESPYRLVEAAPMLGAWTVHFLTSRTPAHHVRWRRVAGAALACGLAVAGPLAYFQLQVSEDTGSRLYGPMHAADVECQTGPHPGMVEGDAGLISEGWLDPVALARPGFLYDDSVDADVYNAHHVLYLGALLPLLVLALWRVGRRRGSLLLWALLIGGAMALGPALHWGGNAVCVGGRPLPGPMAFLRLIPGTEALGAFYRTFLSVVAAVALVIGMAWPLLLRRMSGAARFWSTGLAMLLLLADGAFLSPLRFPVPVVTWSPPVAAQTLAAQVGDGGVLVVPDIHRESLRDGEERFCGFIWQFHIRKPLRFKVPEACAAQPLLNLSKPHEMPRYESLPDRRRCLTKLRALGIMWVLFIGPNAQAPGQYDDAGGLLGEWLGQPTGEESSDGSRLYQVLPD